MRCKRTIDDQRDANPVVAPGEWHRRAARQLRSDTSKATLYRTLAACVFLACVGPAAAQSWCTPGARLNVSSSGIWYAASAISSADGKCLVHYDKFSSSSDERIGPDRAAPLGQTTPFSQAGLRGQALAAPSAVATGGGAGVKAGHYHCTFFAQGSLTTVPGFTVTGSSYRHDNGGGGSVRYDGGMVEFVGGALAGQAGKVEPGIIRLFNERRSRTVIDCENR